MTSGAFEQAEDVAVGVLEPSRLHALGDIEIALLFKPGHVILFEEDALVFKVAHLGFNVVDVEGQRGRLVGPRKLGAVDADRRVAALNRHPYSGNRLPSCYIALES